MGVAIGMDQPIGLEIYQKFFLQDQQNWHEQHETEYLGDYRWQVYGNKPANNARWHG